MEIFFTAPHLALPVRGRDAAVWFLPMATSCDHGPGAASFFRSSSTGPQGLPPWACLIYSPELRNTCHSPASGISGPSEKPASVISSILSDHHRGPGQDGPEAAVVE